MEDMKIYNAIVGAKMAATIAGTDNYNQLSNQPKINSVTLTGNKTSSDLGLQPTIDSSHKLDPANVSFSEAQSSALSSGIDSAKVGQIATSKAVTDCIALDSGINLYITATEPEGDDIPEGSIGIGFSADGTVKTYTDGAWV